MSYYQWRALIGPRYNHYDWVGINYGSTAALVLSAQLSGAIANSSVTTIGLTSTAGLPSASGVWIVGTYGTAGEYVQYAGKNSTQLTGCTREAATANNHNGYHEADEKAWLWYPIDDDDGVWRFSFKYDAKLSTINWTGACQGFKGRHWLLRNNHLIVVQTRTSPGASWATEMVGVIDNPNWRDDGKRTAKWSLKIRGLDSIWAGEKVRGVKVGQLDIAKQSDASSTTPLVLASDERDTGDYVIAAADFTAEKAVDDDQGTLWIGERFIGTSLDYTYPNSDGRNNDGLKFSQIYINPPVDAPPGARWIELILMTGNANGYTLYSATGTPSDAAWGLEGSQDGIEGMEPGDLAILCEDLAVFQQLNPLSSAAVTIENKSFFDLMDAAGGALRLRIGASNFWRSWVEWGDGNGGIQHEDFPSETYGTRVAAPAKGQTLRYDHGYTGSSNSWEFWQVGKIHCAGYKVDTTPDEWLMITLPGLGLMLRDDITSSDPGNGEKLYIVDASGEPNTAGLASSGTLQIGSERIAYASKDEEGVTLAGSGARGASSTTAAGHKADDLIYIVEGGVVTDAHMIDSIAWRRYGGTIYPHNFDVYTSNLVNPRSAGDAHAMDDYAQIEGITSGSSSSWVWNFGSPVRIKAIVIRIEEMTTDPARARISEVEAILNPAYYLSSLWLDNGTSVQEVIETLFAQVGMPASAINVSGGLPALSEVETAADTFWNVITDLAEFAGLRITVGRDSKWVIATDAFWTATPSYTHTWDETNILSIEKVDQNDKSVSQVKVLWRTPDGSSSGEEFYPATEGALGEVLEVEEQIFTGSSQAQTAARKKYYLAHFPYTVVIESTTAYPTMKPGEVHRVRWTWNLTDGVQERLYLVQSVDHWIEKSRWYTTVYLQQIERVAGY